MENLEDRNATPMDAASKNKAHPCMPRPSAENVAMLGKLLAEATQQHLWLPVAQTFSPVTLTIRTGAGRATWHRYDRQRKLHQISFGAGMIADKLSFNRGEQWLSAREIRKFGYFGGQVSALNLLAHTACHEFAHLLQTQAGGRQRGQVHNTAFYAQLDQLHTSGTADRVRAHLQARSLALGVPLAETCIAASAPPHPLKQLWQAGDLVTFAFQGQLHRGRISRVNQRTCSVRGLGAVSHVRFRIPPHLLQKDLDQGQDAHLMRRTA